MNLNQMLEQLADEKRNAEEELLKIQRAIQVIEELKLHQEDRGISDNLISTSAALKAIQSHTGTG